MPDDADKNKLLIVAGATLRAEELDRPLAYRLRDEIESRLGDGSRWSCLVISDIWYLNSEPLHARPAISIGGPGVNAVAQYWFNRLPNALEVENVLLIQMDTRASDLRCSIWGMDHETTVEALETFVQKGYLDRFLEGLRSSL